MELGIRNTAGSCQLQDIQGCGLRTLYFWDFPSTFAKENIREWSLGINPSASLPTASAWAKLPERRNENHTDIQYLCLHLLHALYVITKNATRKDPSTACEDAPPLSEWKSPGNSAQIWQKRQTPFWDIPESDVYIFSPDISYTVVFITSCSDYVRRNGIF